MPVIVTHRPPRANVIPGPGSLAKGSSKSRISEGATVVQAQTFAFADDSIDFATASESYTGATSYDISIVCDRGCKCRIDVNLEASVHIDVDTYRSWLDSLSDGDVIAAAKAATSSSLSGKTATAAAQSGDGDPVPFLAVKGVSIQIKKGQGAETDSAILVDQKSFAQCNAIVMVGSSISLLSKIWWIVGGTAEAEARASHTITIRGYCVCDDGEKPVLNQVYTNGKLISENGRSVIEQKSEETSQRESGMLRKDTIKNIRQGKVEEAIRAQHEVELESILKPLRAAGASPAVTQAAIDERKEALGAILSQRASEDTASREAFKKYVETVRQLTEQATSGRGG